MTITMEAPRTGGLSTTATINCAKLDLFNAILYIKYEATGVAGKDCEGYDHGV